MCLLRNLKAIANIIFQIEAQKIVDRQKLNKWDEYRRNNGILLGPSEITRIKIIDIN